MSDEAWKVQEDRLLKHLELTLVGRPIRGRSDPRIRGLVKKVERTSDGRILVTFIPEPGSRWADVAEHLGLESCQAYYNEMYR